jgi:hypothetical protein
MIAHNKPCHIRRRIIDFDAVSLYPSAMKRLYTVEGLPELIPNDQLNYDYLSRKTNAFMIEIEITAVDKHYAFPLTS